MPSTDHKAGLPSGYGTLPDRGGAGCGERNGCRERGSSKRRQSRVDRSEAARALSERPSRRWRDRCEAEGLYDRRLGRASTRRAGANEVARVTELLDARCRDRDSGRFREKLFACRVVPSNCNRVRLPLRAHGRARRRRKRPRGRCLARCCGGLRGQLGCDGRQGSNAAARQVSDGQRRQSRFGRFAGDVQPISTMPGRERYPLACEIRCMSNCSRSRYRSVQSLAVSAAALRG